MHFHINTTLRRLTGIMMLLAAVLPLAAPGYAQTQPGKSTVTGTGGEIPPPAENVAPEQADKRALQPDSPEGCEMTFSDVHPSDYFYEAVRYLYCHGDISGYSDNTFRPGNPATRGQLAKIIVLAKDWPLENPSQPSFSDVPRGSTYYTYVETAKDHGVINGYSDGTFRVNENITRAQLSKIVTVAQAWPQEYPNDPSFSDVPKNSPFYGYIEAVAKRGIIGGYPDGTFRPNNNATRGQISKIIYYAVTGATPPPPPPPSTPTPVPSPTPQGFHLTTQEQETVDLINQRRAEMGLHTLRVNEQLTMAARRHSNDIGPKRLCQHNGTDGSTPWTRAADAGYTGFASGEVVGCNYSTPEGVVNGWWNSPGHYAILVGAAPNEIGCGWWLNSDGYGWQTCLVGTSQ